MQVKLFLCQKMAVIFSEVQEDFFLNFINSSLFNDDCEEGDGEDTGATGERIETSDETCKKM